MTEELTDIQSAALAQIRPRRRGSPITGTQVAAAIGLKPRANGKAGADMRAVVHALRVKGWPVCASGDGYWWPADSAELSAYISSFEGRVLDQERALSGLRAGFDKIDDSREPERSPYAPPPHEPSAPPAPPSDPSRAGIYVIERKWPAENSYIPVAAHEVDAFLAANPTAKKVP